MANIKVGLVGAGWWAHDIHAPMHQNNDGTELVGVWARNPEKARAFAEEFGIQAFEDYDEMLAAADAVDFAVPPSVQAELALRAAEAGKALILEKPLAGTLEEAQKLVEVIEKNNIPNLVCFTRRFSSASRRFLEDVENLKSDGEILALQGHYVHAGLLGGGPVPASGTWRNEFHGLTLDIGPHSMNMAIAALGPITHVKGTSGKVVRIESTHEFGATSQILMSGHIGVPKDDFQEAVFSTSGKASFDEADVDHPECWTNVHAEFLAAYNDGAPVTTNARDALEAQAVLEAVIESHDKDGAVVEVKKA